MPQQESQPGAPYIEPALGIDALRDAAAAVRCCAANDNVGLHAILAGTDAPRHVANVLACMTVAVCRRGGLDDQGITALLAEITDFISDWLLDQRPEQPRQEVI